MRGVVLIVDDDAGMRAVLREVVEAEGYRVTESYDGADGVEAYRQIHPDIVLMDLRLPRLSGLEATALIAQEDPEARIFVVTAINDPSLRSVVRSAGASGYILKEDLTRLRGVLRNPRELKPS